MIKHLHPLLLCDFYKVSHRGMYPDGTEMVYSTWTPRASRMEGVNEVVFFGLQYFIKKYLIEYFNEHFFGEQIGPIVESYKEVLKLSLNQAEVDTTHIQALHRLGYLPLSIRALPEGTRTPLRVPMFTIHNTHPEFFWLTNYIETLISCEVWQACTSATIADQFRKLFEAYSYETVGNTHFVPYQGHDFSMRGMASLDSAVASGMGHLLSFVGTDVIPAILGAHHYYGAPYGIGQSVPATEHSVQCAYGKDATYIEEILCRFPTGIISVVSDGYDFWHVLSTVLPYFRDAILKRDGKFVVRPDSGDPETILCGDTNAPSDSPQALGALRLLYATFQGQINQDGYKELDPHVGLIYGDAITLDRAKSILSRMKEMGFASTNVVFGIGSYTYQYNTRDTFGFALKSTLCIIDGKEVPIFKNPVTDDGVKKSQKGRVAVVRDKKTGHLICQENVKWDEMVQGDHLETVFHNGRLVREHRFYEIKARLQEGVQEDEPNT